MIQPKMNYMQLAELNEPKVSAASNKQPKAKNAEPLLIQIDTASYMYKGDNKDLITLVNHVIFYHDGAYLHCDSAIYNEATNSFEAFDNVHMVQGDTIFLDGDYMHYDGNTMLVKVRYDVVLEHRPQKVKLYTDSLDYDRAENIAYYFDGGKLIDTLNILNSDWGQYEPNLNLAKFLDNVILKNPNFTLYSEELDYYTDRQLANILSESTIASDSGTIYTSSGWYNTNTEESILLNRSLIVNKAGDQTLTGDSIFYNKLKGFGEVYGNMVLKDTTKKVILRGNYAFYNEFTDYAMATDSAYAIDYSQGDSLYIHADTLKLITIRNEYQKELPKIDINTLMDSTVIESLRADSISEEGKYKLKLDSLSLAADSQAREQASTIQSDLSLIQEGNKEILNKDSIKTEEQALKTGEVIKLVKAYYGVRFYRSDMQGVCDSMQFSSADSVLHLYRDPVIWNEGNQLSGDTIDVFMNDSTINYVHVKRYSFSIEKKDSLMYNQMKGRSLKAFFNDGRVREIFVEGNAETITYPEDDKDKSVIGLNWLESGYLRIWLNKDNSLEKLLVWPMPTGQTTPLELVEPEQRRLEGFFWYDYLRPLNKDDIFRKIKKRVEDQRANRSSLFDLD